MSKHRKRALVTGGAGLIGAHLADLLIEEGWRVRVLDNIEPNTHKRGKPAWINKQADFKQGDLRDRETITQALRDIDVVFHQAAYGGYMPEIAKYVHVNSLGTAQMLEVIREKNLPIKKVIVASSQAVYSEGAGSCPKHGLVFPNVRPVEQLKRGDWSVRCPICNQPTTSVPTPENAPVGSGKGVSVREIAQRIGDALGIKIEPEINSEFRPGEMRHLTSATDRVCAIGYEPKVDLEQGIGRYLDWIRSQSDVRDYFSGAADILRCKGIVHRVASSA